MKLDTRGQPHPKNWILQYTVYCVGEEQLSVYLLVGSLMCVDSTFPLVYHARCSAHLDKPTNIQDTCLHPASLEACLPNTTTVTIDSEQMLLSIELEFVLMYSIVSNYRDVSSDLPIIVEVWVKSHPSMAGGDEVD